MQFIFSREEKEQLKAASYRYKVDISPLDFKDAKIKNQLTYKVRIDEEQFIDEIREACIQLLETIGFDDNDEPTKEGKTLESLIDKLYIG